MVDRARFLALASVLAGCGGARAPERSRAAAATPAVVSVAAAPSAAPSPAVADAFAPAPPPPLPPCDTTIEVAECVDFGLPGPTCEQGSEPAASCVRLRNLLAPVAARAAVQCFADQAGTCRLHAQNAEGACFAASLSSACEVLGASVACERVLGRCRTRVSREVCVAAVSAVKDEADRTQFVDCFAKRCSLDCFGSVAARQPGPKLALAKRRPPSRAVDLARYPTRGSPLPPSFTTCTLETDCVAVWTSGCSYAAVNQRAAGVVGERVRQDEKKHPDQLSRVAACQGPPDLRCSAGTCSVAR